MTMCDCATYEEQWADCGDHFYVTVLCIRCGRVIRTYVVWK